MHQRQPLGNPWYQTGLTCATIANFNAWGSKRIYKPEDFMPVIRKPLTTEQLRQKFVAAMAGLGVAVVRSKPE